MNRNVLSFVSQQPQSSLRLRELLKDKDGEITKWLRPHPGARAKFRIRVEHMQRIARTEWNKTQFRKLQYGLSEIKWHFDKKEFRAVGFDFEGSFIMLVGCTHKMSVYDPPNWLRTAKRLKGEVENGQWKTLRFEP